jgi:hypothetical protein
MDLRSAGRPGHALTSVRIRRQRLTVAALTIAGVGLVIGVVYFATSVSRDVRLLTERLLEQEERQAPLKESGRGVPPA